ncbi:MAG: helix-turn-helix transcriptional regulator [Rhodospirillales bacterium]|nr:helix-turn-helix transcriptional regulator [Acetobacter sp.]
MQKNKPRFSRFDCHPGCAVEATISLIDSKWKSVALFHLLDGTTRFNELRRKLQGVTQRMLTKQLRELEADGIINRQVFAQVPPKVEYSLTPLGRTLEPVLDAMKLWGDANLKLFGQASKGEGQSTRGDKPSAVGVRKTRPRSKSAG